MEEGGGKLPAASFGNEQLREGGGEAGGDHRGGA